MSCLAWICRLRNTDHTSTLTDFQKYSSFGLDDLLKVSFQLELPYELVFIFHHLHLHSILLEFLLVISFPDQLFRNKPYKDTGLPGREKLQLFSHHPVITTKASFARLMTCYFKKQRSFWTLQSSLFLSSPHLTSPRPKRKVLCKWTRNPSHTDSVQICNITSSISSFPVDLWQVLYDCMCKFPIIAMSCFSNVLKDLLSKQNTTK